MACDCVYVFYEELDVASGVRPLLYVELIGVAVTF
jgi:hypothetical protein